MGGVLSGRLYDDAALKKANDLVNVAWENSKRVLEEAMHLQDLIDERFGFQTWQRETPCEIKNIVEARSAFYFRALTIELMCEADREALINATGHWSPHFPPPKTLQLTHSHVDNVVVLDFINKYGDGNLAESSWAERQLQFFDAVDISDDKSVIGMAKFGVSVWDKERIEFRSRERSAEGSWWTSWFKKG